MLGLGAYLIWGVMPLYFKLLGQRRADRDRRPPHPLVAALPRRAGDPVAALAARSAPRWRRGQVLITLIVTALLIAVNWLVYIYAVVSGHVLEGSLGYYLNPLVNVLLGVVLLKERLSRAAGLRLPARRRRRRGARGRRRLGPVDQPDARGQLRALRLPAEGRAGRRARRAVGRDRDPRAGRARLDALAAGSRARAASADSGSAPTCCWSSAARSPRSRCCCSPRRRRRLPYSTLGFLQYIAPSLQFLLAVLGVRRAAHAAPMRSASARSGSRSPSSASRRCARARARGRRQRLEPRRNAQASSRRDAREAADEDRPAHRRLYRAPGRFRPADPRPSARRRPRGLPGLRGDAEVEHAVASSTRARSSPAWPRSRRMRPSASGTAARCSRRRRAGRAPWASSAG